MTYKADSVLSELVTAGAEGEKERVGSEAVLTGAHQLDAL